MTGREPWLGPLAAALVLGPAFWLAASFGSELPPSLAMRVTLDGGPPLGYGGHATRPLAPLSPRIIADARHDAGPAMPAGPGQSAPPGLATPTPTAAPSPPSSPTSPVLPGPSPTALPLPTPTPLPPTPTVPPVIPTPTLPSLPGL